MASKEKCLTYHKGEIALMHYLLPQMADEVSLNSVFTHEQGVATVIPVPIATAREILMTDEVALSKFWKHLAYRMIYFEKNSRLTNYNQDAI